jgi:methylated-DNA-[protein]-cysteine S-methyltransferase
MTTLGVTFFDTTIGCCALGWNERGIIGVQLPEAREPDTRARMFRRFPTAEESPPPPDVAAAIAGITALLRGEAPDLSGIILDMEGVPPFHQRVYQATRTIPPGATISYGEIATRTGDPIAVRAVGQALGENPYALLVPCHRVVAADGKVGGFSGHGGRSTKLRLLTIEEGLGPLGNQPE